jgi:hypothetical protein
MSSPFTRPRFVSTVAIVAFLRFVAPVFSPSRAPTQGQLLCRIAAQ